jgi:hypothetical protein
VAARDHEDAGLPAAFPEQDHSDGSRKARSTWARLIKRILRRIPCCAPPPSPKRTPQDIGSIRNKGPARRSVSNGPIIPTGRQASGYPADTWSVKSCPVMREMFRRRARQTGLAETERGLRTRECRFFPSNPCQSWLPSWSCMNSLRFPCQPFRYGPAIQDRNAYNFPL